LRTLGREWRIRWRIHRGRWSRRGGKPCSRDAVSVAAGLIDAEVYRIHIRGDDGLGISVYVGGEEVFRFDCLGPAGHYHVNLRQAMFASAGRVPRHRFASESVEAQAAESLEILKRDLENALETNWLPEVRVIATDLATHRAIVDAIAARLPEYPHRSERAGQTPD
jgi:hypothetical protein